MSQTVGQLLRETREARGQTLEDAERSTRIRAKFLAALEADNFAALSSTAQARGFLNNYAQYLGLDTGLILDRYDQTRARRSILPSLRPSTNRRSPERRQGEVRPAGRTAAAPGRQAGAAPTPRSAPAPGAHLGRAPQVRSRRPRLLSPDLLVATVITLLLVGLLLWGSSQLAAGLAATATSTFTGDRSEGGSTLEAVGTTTLPPAEATATIILPAPLASYTGVNVMVRAEQRTWLRVTVDGVEAYVGLLPPGESRDFVGQSVVEVVTGNGKGTRVIWNGQDQGVLGELGEVVDRLWTLTGMVIPTPTITPTPTKTQRPTRTPVP